MRTHKELVLDIRRWLSEFCTECKGLISAEGYDWLDCMVQDIDRELQGIDRQAEGAAMPRVRVIGASCRTRAATDGA
jgi:hypothetical protein